MPIYEKSTTQILTEYINETLAPGSLIDKDQIVKWFKEKFPKIKSNTVNCHIIKFTTNHKTRIHYNAKPQNDMLFQLPDGHLRRYDPEKDPPPIYKAGDRTLPLPLVDDSSGDTSEFAYESHLRDFLSNNLHIMEPGLRLYTDVEDESITGIEFDAGGKYIDILARDKDDNYVVIELKVSKGYERVIGQIFRYRAWIKQNLAEGKKVRSVIIAKSITPDLKLAASEAPDIELFEYDLKIDLRRIV